jgi:hypothetical protein
MRKEGYAAAMTAETTPRRRLNPVWRAFLCMAAVIAVPVVTFVLIGLWPGAGFKLECFGMGIARMGITVNGARSAEVTVVHMRGFSVVWERRDDSLGPKERQQRRQQESFSIPVLHSGRWRLENNRHTLSVSIPVFAH